MLILVVEDEPGMASLLHLILTEEGHTVAVAKRGDEALSMGLNTAFDLIVLDLMIPGIDGFAVAQKLRESRVQTPLLVLTARRASTDIVKALDQGADDYLTKPFPLAVFLARVRAVTRRGSIPIPVCLEAGALMLNTSTREVTRGGEPVSLTPREYSLLELLLRNKARVVSRSTIVETIWGYDTEITDNTLDVFIRSLRSKIELEGTPRLIRTVRGVGYCLQDSAL
jgi:DNA-binding response OmpR family regulator